MLTYTLSRIPDSTNRERPRRTAFHNRAACAAENEKWRLAIDIVHSRLFGGGQRVGRDLLYKDAVPDSGAAQVPGTGFFSDGNEVGRVRFLMSCKWDSA